jgi:hypothetical protein
MAPTMLARTRSRTLQLLLLPLSCLIAAGCGKPSDPTPAADGEFQVLVTSKALALTASADPATVSAGGKVTLTAQVTTSRATSIDVVIGVKNASGGSSYSTPISGQPIGPTTPFQFQDALTTTPADPSGTWTLSVTVRHTATGKVLIENDSAATFTVTGGSTPGGGGGGSNGGGGGGSGTGACAGSAVFCDDFTNASLKDSYTTDGRGSWVRGAGTYTATYEAEAYKHPRSLLAGDYTDFDVTLQGKSMGDAGFGLSYAAQAAGDDGFAVIVHPAQYQGVYLKKLVSGGSDVNLDSYALPAQVPGTQMKLRVKRVGTAVTVWLDGNPIISQDDGGTGQHGKLGPILALTDQLSGSGAVFSLLRVDQATKYGSACTPQCSGKVCGSDGCGGVCGTCTSGQCDTSGQCTGVSSGSWLSGSSGDYVMDGTFAKWRGRTVEIAGTWSDNTAENQQGAWSVQESGTFGSWQGPIDLAVGGIFPDEGESWSKAAGGSYDSRWTTTLNNIKKARQGKGLTFIRFAHEFNGDWFWPVYGDSTSTSDFKKAWIRFAKLQRSVFPDAKLVWCVNDGTSGSLDLDVRDAFPGADYVDVIGVDSYNNWPAAGTQNQFEEKINMTDGKGAPVGIEKWRQFAKDQGLPLAIPEWSGCAIENTSSNTEVAVDYPVYMEQFYAWLKDNAGTGPGQVWYEIIFNIAAGFGDDYAPESSGGKYQLYPVSNMPNSAKRYAELW